MKIEWSTRPISVQENIWIDQCSMPGLSWASAVKLVVSRSDGQVSEPALMEMSTNAFIEIMKDMVPTLVSRPNLDNLWGR